MISVVLPRSLRARVTVIGVLTLALVLGLGAWATVRALDAGLRSDLNAQNEEVLDALAQSIADGADVETLLLPVGADGTDFLILDEDDVVLNASIRPAGAEEVPSDLGVSVLDEQLSDVEWEELEERFGADSSGIFFVGSETGQVFVQPADWFETLREVTSPNDGDLTLIATSPVGVINRSLNRLTVALMVIVPILVLLGGFALWLATGAALRPVRQIAAEADRIAPSNSGDRLPVPDTGDEIAGLTRTLNTMLDRLDDGLVRQRQFISDASHELRSPLTTITGAAELVAGNRELPADAEPAVSLLQRGAARLEAVLDDVTQLADGDGGQIPVELDLDQLVRREVDIAANLPADGDPIDFDDRGVSPLVMTGHRLQLGRAVQNLLANAARHATRQVAVSVREQGDRAEIIVDDDGPGVPAADRERVFDRFVRLDDGRSRLQGGSGLGLAIVAAIARNHGGAVYCEDGPLGGARFRISLPRG